MKNTKKTLEKGLDDSMQNAVKVYDYYKGKNTIPPLLSDDYGIYKYGEWIVKNIL